MDLIKKPRARVFDVAGFVVFVGLSVIFFLRMPEMLVLLVPMIRREWFSALSHSIVERLDSVEAPATGDAFVGSNREVGNRQSDDNAARISPRAA